MGPPSAVRASAASSAPALFAASCWPARRAALSLPRSMLTAARSLPAGPVIHLAPLVTAGSTDADRRPALFRPPAPATAPATRTASRTGISVARNLFRRTHDPSGHRRVPGQLTGCSNEAVTVVPPFWLAARRWRAP